MKKLIYICVLILTLPSCFLIRWFHKPTPGNWWMSNLKSSNMAQVKKQSVSGSITNAISDATAKRLGDGKVYPIKRPINLLVKIKGK